VQFEIVDGWLYYTGPVECVQAEEAGHLMDFTRAELAKDDAGEPFTRNGQVLYRAPLLDGAPAPRPQLRLVAPPAAVGSELELQVRAAFERHLGPLYFQDQQQPPPEPTKALELLELELARKTSDLAAALVERDEALVERAAALRELEQMRLALKDATKPRELDELEQPYNPIAEVP
jgi:hypothetical protein